MHLLIWCSRVGRVLLTPGICQNSGLHLLHGDSKFDSFPADDVKADLRGGSRI